MNAIAIQNQNPLVNVFNAVIDNVNQLAVNARDLHSFLDVKTRFNDWIKHRIEEYQFIANLDFISFTQNSVKPTGGRPTVEYHLTLNMAKELAMVENNEQGRKVRRYFIQCEKELYKSDSEQRKPLIAVCDKLAVSTSLRSQAYTTVANHFGYNKPIEIPVPLIAEATAFAYELLLARQKAQPTSQDDMEYNAFWRTVGLLEYERISKEKRKLQQLLNDTLKQFQTIHASEGLLYDAIAEQRIKSSTSPQERLAKAQAFIERQLAMKA